MVDAKPESGCAMDGKNNLNSPINKIIEQYKTPLHIVDRNKIQGNCRGFMRAFQGNYVCVDFFYSYKTNSAPAILEVIHDEGFGAEVVSGFELELALRLGVKPERIIFNGPAKTAFEIEKAIDLGIKLINLDSPDELTIVSDLADKIRKKVSLGLRIRSAYDKTAHFGFPSYFNELTPFLERIKASKYLDLKALHLHQGTDIRKVTPYLKAVKRAARLLYAIKKTFGTEIEFLDLGGGLGIATARHVNYLERILRMVSPYEPRIKDVIQLGYFSSKICTSLNDEFRKFGLKLPRLFLEPGRAIIADAQDLFLSVVRIKGKTVIVNGGALSFALPLRSELHDVDVLGKECLPRREYYKVCGNLCASSDIFFDHARLPSIEKGDIMIIKGTGAYFNSLSSNFSFPLPAVVMLEDGIRGKLIRRREGFEDMVATDITNSKLL